MTQMNIENSCTIFTIGFTKKDAAEFFGLINKNRIKLLVDVRLNNKSQLAGFTKENNLRYFLKELGDCSYEHKPEWAPGKQILDDYKKKIIEWHSYEKQYIALLESQNIVRSLDLTLYNNSCLLCSEPSPEQCHRRLLAEYLQKKFSNVIIRHL